MLVKELNDKIAKQEKDSIGLEKAAKRIERDIIEGQKALQELVGRRQ